jgi:hypothetical protein
VTIEINPKQTLLLWALLAKGGTAAQAEIKPDVEASDREILVGAGLLTTRKGPRGSIWLEATDKGWDWAGKHLDAPLPGGKSATKFGTPILEAWLTRLKTYMQASEVSLAEILVPSKTTEQPATAGKEPAEDSNLRDRIRRAFFEIAGNPPTNGVLLSRIRAKLADVDRATLDEALIRMHGEEGTTLMSLDNPREIAAEGDASLNFKGQFLHVLWIKK